MNEPSRPAASAASPDMPLQAAGPSHVIIVGAGIVGVATAIRLQRGGSRVTLLDRTGPGAGASHGNGGVLASCAIVPVTVPGLLRKAPGMLLDPRQPLFLQWRYLRALAPWMRAYLRNCRPDRVAAIADALYGLIGDSLADHQALAAGTGAERFVVPSDYAYLYRDRTRFEADSYGWDIRRAHGFHWDELEGQALRDWEPLFSPDLRFAARLSGHGSISDPGAYVRTLARHVEEKGGRILKAEVTDFRVDGGRVTGVRASGEMLDCDGVVIATGAWSRPMTAKLGLEIPLEGERGYHIELIEPDRMPIAPCMIAAGKFVVTPMEGRIRLAGIVEFGHIDAPASRAPFALLRRSAAAAMPGLRWRDVSEWMGVRPAPSDSIPLIGPVPGVSGAWLGLGHHHVGLTAGPKTGDILAGMIQGRQSNMDLAAFDPVRFAA